MADKTKQKPGPKPKPKPWVRVDSVTLESENYYGYISKVDREYVSTDFSVMITGTYGQGLTRQQLRKELRKAINAWYHNGTKYYLNHEQTKASTGCKPGK